MSSKSNKTPVSLIIEEFDPQEREVAEFTMSFYQSTDADGQVTEMPRGGKITMRLKVLNVGNTNLVCWMVDKKQAYSGRIEFHDTKNNKPMKTINFTDAYCVYYDEH
jgi:ligand-binding SRPBCC domain-containing protein